MQIKQRLRTEPLAEAPHEPPEPHGPPIAARVGMISLRFGMVWALIVLVIAAQLLYPTFLTWDNLLNLMSQNAALAIIAVGMTFVIICGGFDLSVGSVYGLGAVTFAAASDHMSLVWSVVAAIVIGLLAGLLNALIITVLSVNPFVATLGTASGFLGVAYVYSNSNPVVVASGHDGLGLGTLSGVPISGVIAVLVFLVGGVVLARSVFGQNLYAVGGSAEAARLAGLRVKAVRGATYVVVGGLSGFAGAIDSSKLGVAQADQGQTLPLLAITVVILGGTALLGGDGAMWRTVVGLLIIVTLNGLFDSLAINTAVQLIVQCTVLVVAVSFDNVVRTFSSGRRRL